MEWTRASSKGISVKVDVEGRIYLPSDLRVDINLDPGEQLEVYITEQGDLLLRRSSSRHSRHQNKGTKNTAPVISKVSDG